MRPVAVRPAYPPKNEFWVFLCRCGKEYITARRAVADGSSGSCGYGNIAAIVARNTKHGKATRSEKSRLYKAWVGMRARCRNANHAMFANYGGRGISVCARWDDFAVFCSDVGERPLGHSLDRINNDGNYEPGNVRWATAKQQANNRRAPLRGKKP